jgi:NAD(P)H dehydrogenase (quinone)
VVLSLGEGNATTRFHSRNSRFRSQGMKNPMPRIRVIDGFNEGWIDFERAGERRQGTVTLETVIARLTGKGDTA